MTGIMINTVPRRVILNPGATLRQTLERIQSEQLEIIAHETVSLAELQSEGGVPVSTLFNTILNFRNKEHAAIGGSDNSLRYESLFLKARSDSRDRYAFS